MAVRDRQSAVSDGARGYGQVGAQQQPHDVPPGRASEKRRLAKDGDGRVVRRGDETPARGILLLEQASHGVLDGGALQLDEER